MLHKVNGQDTVFEGRLLKEQSRVSVSVEDASDPDDVEVRYGIGYLNRIIPNMRILFLLSNCKYYHIYTLIGCIP